MSLIYRLPLRDTPINIGLVNGITSQNNISILKNGKIGKCYSTGKAPGAGALTNHNNVNITDSSGANIMLTQDAEVDTPSTSRNNSYLSIEKEVARELSTSFSIALWLRIDSWNLPSETYVYGGTGGSAAANYIFGLLRDGSNSHISFIISNGTTSTSNNCHTSELEKEKWYHITCTYTPGTMKIYLNGELDTTYTTAVTPDFTKVTSFLIGAQSTLNQLQTDASFNDFRLYDHCLTDYEIKRIAQALILHFPLNDGYVTGSQTISRFYDISGYCQNGNAMVNALSSSSDVVKYNSSISFNGTDDGIIVENLQLSDIINSEVTYAFWIKPNSESGYRSIYFSSYDGVSWSIEKTTGNIVRSYWNGNPDETCVGATINDNTWQHVCITKSGDKKVKVYINGRLKWETQATYSKLNFPTTYYIGRDTRSGDGTPYKGLMSDFRIYSTAFTDKEVLSLYQNSATIDDNGNIHGQIYE